MVIIYGLFDPSTGELRYVGKSVVPARRLLRHIWDAEHVDDPTWCQRWIRGLLRRGLSPEMETLEIVPESQAPEAERFWIAYFRGLGCGLTNLTEGGDGVHGRRWSAAMREKFRASRAGIPRSPETKVRISAAKRGIPQTAAQRAKSSVMRRGRPWPGMFTPGHVMTPEVRARISATTRGRPNSGAFRAAHTRTVMTPERRARIAATLRGRPLSEERRLRISNAHRGRPLSQAHREAIRQALLNHHRAATL